MNKTIPFSYQDSCGITGQEFDAMHAVIAPEVERIAAAIDQRYATDYASLYLSYDDQLLVTVDRVIAQKKAMNPTMLIVIGIGGSNLGTLAVAQAIQGSLYNEQQPALKIYFADTVDTDHIHALMILAQKELEGGNGVILNVVSKSGTTTETIANFEILLELVRHYKKHAYADYVVATTDKNSKLWQLAQQEKFSCLEIPQRVGGRFSVFSAVGLFPLGMLGIDLEKLRAGARSAVETCCTKNVATNPALATALALFLQHKKGITIHDTFLFAVDLEGIGRWYRQLLGESIGKEYDRAGMKVHAGITPTVSIGSTDLHSVGQLYLGGPRDKFTSFVTVQRARTDEHIPHYKEYESLVAAIQGKPLAMVMQAIVQGTQAAYMREGLPFVVWALPEKSEWYIGNLLQCKMIEILYLGFLYTINPFDQPNVESYKQETRKILAHE